MNRDERSTRTPGGAMSELAYDKEGEPIEQHEDCEFWRVRRFRNPGMRGTCETVREDDGAPLYVAADCSFLEFKRLVSAEPGFYRLDQCDVGRQPIGDGAPAYVSITEGQRNSAGGSGEDARDNVIRELARANADMCRTIAGQASDMMRAAAELMRAADGAGIPRRAPLPPVEREEEDEDDRDDEDDDDVGDEQTNVWGLIEQMLPTIQVWLASMAAKRSATPTPAATPASAPAPAPAPAPAAAPSAAPASSSAAAGASSPVAEAQASSSSPTTVTTPAAEPATPAEPVRNAAVTPDQLAHLLAIRARLTPREAAIADAVVTRMTSEVQTQWLAELSAMTVDQAVEVVRSMIPKPPATTPAAVAPATKDGT